MSMQTLLLSPDTRSKMPLWVVFWIFGVLASHVLFAVVLYAQIQQRYPLLWILLAGFVVYTLAIVRAVWTSADNVKDKRWGEVARYLTVAWALNAVLVSGFLALNRAPLF